MVVVMARRVDGEPWAQMRRSEPVCIVTPNYQPLNLLPRTHTHPTASILLNRIFDGGEKKYLVVAYRHHLPPLPPHPLPRTHIHNGTIQASTRPFHHPHNQKHPALPRHLLQPLPRPITPLPSLQSPLHPVLPRPRRRIPQINSTLEIPQELFAALRGACAHGSAEVAGAWVPAEVGFGEEEEVDAEVGGAVGGGGEGGESGGGGGEGAGLGDGEVEGFGGHGGGGVVERWLGMEVWEEGEGC